MSDKNIKGYPVKTCLFLTEEEFEEIFTEIFGEYDEDTNPVEFEFDPCEGIYFCGIANEDVYSKLSEYFDVTVTSVHSDGYSPVGIWIVYK